MPQISNSTDKSACSGPPTPTPTLPGRPPGPALALPSPAIILTNGGKGRSGATPATFSLGTNLGLKDGHLTDASISTQLHSVRVPDPSHCFMVSSGHKAGEHRPVFRKLHTGGEGARGTAVTPAANPVRPPAVLPSRLRALEAQPQGP